MNNFSIATIINIDGVLKSNILKKIRLFGV
jgi:hypothetical protein